MELETLFTEQKWNILECLSKEKYSPLQLADKLNTTIANISQQLRLLEAANLVKKEKIPNRERGKPRSLFSLSHNYAYLISTMNGFAKKKLINLTNHQKTILKIWYLDNLEINYCIEKLYWVIQQHINKISKIMVSSGFDSNDIIIVTNYSNKINNILTKKVIKDLKPLKINVVSEGESNKFLNNKFYVVYNHDNKKKKK